MMPMVRAYFRYVPVGVLTRVPVLAKVVSYIGISTIATVIVPLMFEALGWGV